jgi:hypothetical protein
MNIFATSHSPAICAQELDDKRLVKMTLETTQILSTAMHLNGLIGPYKTTHKGHPVVKWTAENDSNFKWTVSLLKEMCKEYTFRYGKTHKCQQYISLFNSVSLRSSDITDFANCSSIKDKDIFSCYRECLINKWENDKRPPRWTNRNKPVWS